VGWSLPRRGALHAGGAGLQLCGRGWAEASTPWGGSMTWERSLQAKKSAVDVHLLAIVSFEQEVSRVSGVQQQLDCAPCQPPPILKPPVIYIPIPSHNDVHVHAPETESGVIGSAGELPRALLALFSCACRCKPGVKPLIARGREPENGCRLPEVNGTWMAALAGTLSAVPGCITVATAPYCTFCCPATVKSDRLLPPVAEGTSSVMSMSATRLIALASLRACIAGCSCRASAILRQQHVQV
jgi:hypothetical protein